MLLTWLLLMQKCTFLLLCSSQCEHERNRNFDEPQLHYSQSSVSQKETGVFLYSHNMSMTYELIQQLNILCNSAMPEVKQTLFSQKNLIAKQVLSLQLIGFELRVNTSVIFCRIICRFYQSFIHELQLQSGLGKNVLNSWFLSDSVI